MMKDCQVIQRSFDGKVYMQRQITIIRGLPGSGKSTYARKMFPGSLLLEGDQAFTDAYGHYNFQPNRCNPVKYVRHMLFNALTCGVPHVVITGTSPDGKAIDAYRKVADYHGYKVNLIWIDFDNGSTCMNNHSVPADVIENMKSKWVELPNETYLQRDVGEAEPHVVDYKPEWFRELQLKRSKEEIKTR